MIRLVSLTVFLLVAAPVRAQIVDTLAGFDPTGEGWSGGLGAAIATTGGNTERLDLSTAARVQWASLRDRWRLLGAYSKATSGDDTIAESAFVHLRQNHRLSDRWWTLLFSQVAHEPFQRLELRTLLGAGLRWAWVEEAGRRVALGAASMLEWERLEGSDSTELDQRLSVYLDVQAPIGEQASVAATGFAQPRWDDLGDLRAILNARLAVALADRLDLIVGSSYRRDSNPPDDVDKTDWSFRTGLELDL